MDSEEYFGLFNARNAKVIAFVVLIAVAPYHSVLHFLSIRKFEIDDVLNNRQAKIHASACSRRVATKAITSGSRTGACCTIIRRRRQL